MRLNFPNDLEDYHKVQSCSVLKAKLHEDLKSSKLLNFVRFRVRELSQKYIYVKCVSCSAQMSYIRCEDDLFLLKKVNTKHQHHQRRTLRQKVKQAILNLPPSLPAKDLRKIIFQKYSLSNSAFYKILSSVRNESLSLQDLVNSFSDNKLIGFYEPLNIQSPFLPDMLIISSLSSRQAFLKYGDVVFFDFTYSLVRERSKNNKEYRVGILTGFSGSMKILPYAVVFTDDQTTESLGKIFFQLFRLLGKSPNTVISDQQASIRAGLNLLEYENLWTGQHLLDSYHILRKFKEKLQNKNHLSFFSQLISAQNQMKFNHLFEQAQQTLNLRDRQVLNHLNQLKEQICYSHTNLNFLGLGVSSSMNEKVNDIAKSLIPRSEKLLVIAKKLGIHFKLIVERNTKVAQIQCLKVEKFLQFPQINQIRRSVCKRIFKTIVKQINMSFRCLYQSNSSGQFRIQDQFGQFQLQLGENQILMCECGFQIRSGLPCSHMLKVLTIIKQKIMPYISERWILKEFVAEIEVKRKIPLPKKSRRNKRK